MYNPSRRHAAQCVAFHFSEMMLSGRCQRAPEPFINMPQRALDVLHGKSLSSAKAVNPKSEDMSVSLTPDNSNQPKKVRHVAHSSTLYCHFSLESKSILQVTVTDAHTVL